MPHDHCDDHSHGANYYLDQLCTIAACGALGGVSVMMYFDGRLKYILTPFFFIPVYAGGCALVVMAVVRAITLWREAGSLAVLKNLEPAAQLELGESWREARAAEAHEHGDRGHDHHHDDHGPDHEHHHHDHDHDHLHHHHDHDHVHNHDHAHSHDCGHDHEHGWTPARYAVLMLPIVLYFLNMPNSTFSAEGYGRMISDMTTEDATAAVTSKAGLVLGFQELTNAAHDKVTRDALEGQTGRLTGMYQPSKESDKQFTLFRVKMSCCAADAIPVGVLIVCDENITTAVPKEWVEVEGQIQFHKLRGQEKWLPVLYLKSASQAKPTAPQNDYGLS